MRGNTTEIQGWRFALDHHDTIRRLCAAQVRLDRRLDLDDLIQDVLLDVARHQQGYDPQRGAPSSWLWWRVRKVRALATQRRTRQDGRERLVDQQPDGPAPDPSPEVVTLAYQALAIATPGQRQAAMLLAAGYTRTEVRAELGISRQALLNRAAKLARRCDKIRD